MVQTLWTILIVICLLLKFEDSSCQNVIRLSREKKNHKKIYLYFIPGEKVKVKFIGGTKLHGLINHITQSTFDVNGKTFSRDTLKRIGKYRKGASIIFPAGIVIGITMIATGNAHSLTNVVLLGAGELIILSQFAPYAGTVDLKKNQCDLDIIDFKDLPLYGGKNGRPEK